MRSSFAPTPNPHPLTLAPARRSSLAAAHAAAGSANRMEFWGIELKPRQTITGPARRSSLAAAHAAAGHANPMEFWGIELKPKQTITVRPGDDHFIHLSQAALGEDPAIDDHATICVHLDGKKLAIGTLSSRERMFQFDLVFERDYEFSNSSRENSVYLSGSMVEKAGDKQEDKGTTENKVKKRKHENVFQMPAKKANTEGDQGDGKVGKGTSKNKVKKTLKKIAPVMTTSLEPGASGRYKKFTPF